MRSKEHAHDYRYFPDPDLLPLVLSEEFVSEIRAKLPELPDEKKARFVADFGISAYDASVLVAEKETAAYFEDVVKGRDPKLVSNWVISELFGRLNKAGKAITESPVSADALGGLVDLIADNTINGRTAKDVFDEMFETGKAAAQIVDEKGLKQITDTSEIEGVVADIIANNPTQVEQYKSGNERIAGWFVGQTMKATGGKANPKLVNEILAKLLK